MAARANYHQWNADEDAKLIEVMVDLVNAGEGFKLDNGFKHGYLKEAETALKLVLPDSGILAKPHIESRLKTLKKDFTIVYDMIYGYNTSGFGYDSEKQCVTAEPAVWEAYLKHHSGAAKWRNESFPFFDELCIVFGKDRAKGDRARDFAEMEEEANREEGEKDDSKGREESHTVPNIAAVDAPNEDCTSVRPKKKRARSLDPLLEGITAAASLLGNKIEEASSKLSEAIQCDMDIQRKTSRVNSELSKIVSLSVKDRYVAAQKITSKPENVLLFFSTKEEDKEEWVRFLLNS